MKNEFRIGSEKPVLMIKFLISAWCNFHCKYCNYSNVSRKREDNFYKGWRRFFLKRNHVNAFDNYSLEEWVRAFERMRGDFVLEISGGEPFLDLNNFLDFIIQIGRMSKCLGIRIDTNGFWGFLEKANSLDVSIKNKIILNISYHPTQITFDQYVLRIEKIINSGWKIGMINFVMENSQKGNYETVREFFGEKGIFVNANPDSMGNKEEQRKELVSYLSEFDLRQKNGELTLGRKCNFPALAYFLLPTGQAYRSCIGEGQRFNFIQYSDSLVALRDATDCPKKKCACLDMYAFLVGSGRGNRLDLINEYVEACKNHQNK